MPDQPGATDFGERGHDEQQDREELAHRHRHHEVRARSHPDVVDGPERQHETHHGGAIRDMPVEPREGDELCGVGREAEKRVQVARPTDEKRREGDLKWMAPATVCEMMIR